MLFVEENEFGDIYDPESNERGSAYDPYYSENLASIINHAIILDSDEKFKSCMTHLNPDGKTYTEKIETAISKLYFNQKENFNRLCFLFFDGILHSWRDDPQEAQNAKEQQIWASRTTFMNIFDINNDIFLLSTANMTEKTIQSYDMIRVESKQPAGNSDASKLDNIRNEMTYFMKEMKGGRLFLDTKAPFKIDDKDEMLIDPDAMSDNRSQDGTGSEAKSCYKAVLGLLGE